MKLTMCLMALLGSLIAHAEMPATAMPGPRPATQGLPPPPAQIPDVPAFPAEPFEPSDLPPVTFELPKTPIGPFGPGMNPPVATQPAPPTPVASPGSVLAGTCPMSKVYLDTQKTMLYDQAKRAIASYKATLGMRDMARSQFGANSPEAEAANILSFQIYLTADKAVKAYREYVEGPYSRALQVCGYQVSNQDGSSAEELDRSLND